MVAVYDQMRYSFDGVDSNLIEPNSLMSHVDSSNADLVRLG